MELVVSHSRYEVAGVLDAFAVDQKLYLTYVLRASTKKGRKESDCWLSERALYSPANTVII